MKKIIFPTVLLIFMVSFSGFAQNQEKKNDTIEVSTLNLEQEVNADEEITLEFKVTDLSYDNKISLIVKFETFKSTSRRSKIKNITNFLNNSDKKDVSLIGLC